MPSKNLTHRYSLPILRPEINFEGNQTLHEDNIWDNSMYKDGKNSQKRRPLFPSREQVYEKQSDFTIKETNSMYKGDIKSHSTHDTHLCLDQVSESELDSRLARLCLSVTKNALE